MYPDLVKSNVCHKATFIKHPMRNLFLELYLLYCYSDCLEMLNLDGS